MKTTDTRALHLVLGGARSGKSRYAEQCAQDYQQRNTGSVVYVATAQANDAEMSERIEHHQQDRPAYWYTVEEPIKLATALMRIQNEAPDSIILIDCLTLWVSNCLLHSEESWQQEKSALLNALEQINNPIIMVSNEVEWSIIMGLLICSSAFNNALFSCCQLSSECSKQLLTQSVKQSIKMIESGASFCMRIKAVASLMGSSTVYQYAGLSC